MDSNPTNESTSLKKAMPSYSGDSVCIDVSTPNGEVTVDPPVANVLNCFTTYCPSKKSINAAIHLLSATICLIGFDLWAFASENSRMQKIGLLVFLIGSMPFWASVPNRTCS